MSSASPETERDGGSSGDRRVFSSRLESFLEQLDAGGTPNSGRFCAFCYNPLPVDFERCDHCGQSIDARPPTRSIPGAIVAMHRRKQRRESLVVNTFAYIGLALGVGLFIAMVAAEYYYVHALWLLLLSIVVLMVGSWSLARLVGGYIGDELGYRYASRHLATDWAAHVAERETEQRQ